MTHSYLLICCCLSCLIGCSPSGQATPNGASADIRAAIQAGDEAWSRAYIAGDTAAMRDLYVDSVVSMQAGARDLIGRGAMVTDFANAIAVRTDTVLRIETVIVSLEHSGRLAWESGHVEFTRRARDSVNAEPRMSRFKYITFWELGVDGKWRIRRDLGVPDAPDSVN
ncbi:MAG: nuclear transport factor 2 family protein [Gemmatimonadota bacterium]